ncbi:Mov34/MPN/PAD-1 family protein [Baekduia sp.]|jgi:proteasome lid subunit RPN8/RPN11|uniref:Mov34/MPN/PAD-1 family protein n=1 Tax=Baekduia sp. TaxID=2600305 RepID=UPI002E0AB0C9|nr:Mov34/MPN/PAD-1 family protein [Baekduia sp.]
MLDDAAMEVPGLDGATREQVYAHVFQATDREVGGVLVGRTGRRGGPPLVTGAIAATEATEQSTTLTFTQDTWEHVHRFMAARFPQDQIVGWYHSHPGHGIFLSEQDLFIHHNFFGDPSQIAWVVDPVAGTEGVFGWSAGKVAEWYTRPTSWPGVTPRRRAATPFPAPSSPPPGTIGPPRRAAAPAYASAPARIDNRPVLPLLGLLLAGVLIGFALWEVALRGDAMRPTAATTVIQPAARSTGPSKASPATTAPAEHVTTHSRKTHSGRTVKTYTVHDPSAIPPPLP